MIQVRNKIKPETAEKQCDFVELQQMQTISFEL